MVYSGTVMEFLYIGVWEFFLCKFYGSLKYWLHFIQLGICDLDQTSTIRMLKPIKPLSPVSSWRIRVFILLIS